MSILTRVCKWAVSCGVLALAAGCGGSPDEPGQAQLDQGPLYLVKSRVFSPEETMGYLTLTDSLDKPPDYSTSMEIPGGGVLYGAPGIGTFMVGAGDEPVVTRYELADDGEFVASRRLSFANEGVLYLYAGSVVFASPTKAYYIDLDQLQAIAFDPVKMEILRTVSLEGAAREGYFTSVGFPVIRSDGIYFAGEWYTDPGWDRVPSGSMLVHLNPKTDEVTYQSDPRCTSMLLAMTNDAGDTYFFSDMFNTFARRGYGSDNGFKDCALRLKAGESSFDPDWELDINSRTGGAAAVAVAAGGDSKVWLQVLDEQAADLPTPADYATVQSAEIWQWHLLDVESDQPALKNSERPLSSSGAIGMRVDGRAFTTFENADSSATTLLELTPDGFVQRAQYPGIIDEIARVR